MVVTPPLIQAIQARPPIQILPLPTAAAATATAVAVAAILVGNSSDSDSSSSDNNNSTSSDNNSDRDSSSNDDSDEEDAFSWNFTDATPAAAPIADDDNPPKVGIDALLRSLGAHGFLGKRQLEAAGLRDSTAGATPKLIFNPYDAINVKERQWGRVDALMHVLSSGPEAIARLRAIRPNGPLVYAAMKRYVRAAYKARTMARLVEADGSNFAVTLWGMLELMNTDDGYNTCKEVGGRKLGGIHSSYAEAFFLDSEEKEAGPKDQEGSGDLAAFAVMNQYLKEYAHADVPLLLAVLTPGVMARRDGWSRRLPKRCYFSEEPRRGPYTAPTARRRCADC